jgi:hypothetical protein
VQMNSILNMEPKSFKSKLNKSPLVQSTTDYKQFKFIKGNRAVMQRHVIGLITSITKHNMLAENPILVNEKMEVIDGQHRLAAAVGLKIPVYYVVVDEIGLTEVQQLNTYARPWRGTDYLNSYVATGKPAYIQFKNFLDEYALTINHGLILVTGDNKDEAYPKFRAGELSFSEEQMKQAREKADMIQEMRRFFVDTGYKSNYFPKAINIIYDKGLAMPLIEKVRQAQPRLERRHSKRDYLRYLEDILNFKIKSNITRLV